MLADEGRISPDDPILQYFPEQDNGAVHPLIGDVTIRNLLMMATCHVENTYDLGDLDWVGTFFHPRKEPDHQPGTLFRYETSATHMLGVLVQRLTGKTFYDDTAYEKLLSILSALEVNVPEGNIQSHMQDEICGKVYALEDNPIQIKDFTIAFSGSHGIVTYYTARGIKHFPFCLGRYADTVLPETHYFGYRMMQPRGTGYRCLNTAVWEKENVFALHTYVIDDYFGNMTARFTFEEDRVRLQLTRNAEWFLDEYNGCANGSLRSVSL